MKIVLFQLAMVSVVSGAIAAPANPTMTQFLASQQLVESGKQVFAENCSGCHGVDATGKGPAAAMLNPKPRNLVAGAFKFRTTPLGSLPTNQDLIRTIEQGVLGTSMPGFPLLSANQKYALVAYIKSLRPDWEKNVWKPLHIPPAPVETFTNKTLMLASAFRGKKLFEEGCLTCHGAKGAGDGPSAEGLMDSDGNPIRPANLGRDRIKSGRRAEDVYKVILTGLDGTPMPSFDGVYTENQIWDLVSYVFFLRGKGTGIYASDLELSETHLKAELEFKKPKTTSESSKSNSEDSWN